MPKVSSEEGVSDSQRKKGWEMKSFLNKLLNLKLEHLLAFLAIVALVSVLSVVAYQHVTDARMCPLCWSTMKESSQLVRGASIYECPQCGHAEVSNR